MPDLDPSNPPITKTGDLLPQMTDIAVDFVPSARDRARHEFLQEIAHGGMGVVFAARDKR